ncbi:MAG: hypothetical protein HRF52_13475 [Ignavibacterium sp.]|jgi:hypothetical protein|uniref:hypothetical protein n=1 Tax=Ignavibacterium sp. TaxID=2651167 RepID=UPI0032979E3B
MLKYFYLIIAAINTIVLAQTSLTPADIINNSSHYNDNWVINVLGTVQDFKKINNSITQFKLTDSEGNYVLVRSVNYASWLPNGRKVKVSGHFYADFGYDGDEQLINLIIVDPRQTNFENSIKF